MSEVDTGETWIDGKPIYRRVFSGTINRPANVRVDTILWPAVTSIKALINVGGWVRYGENGIQQVPIATGTDYAGVYIQTASHNLIFASLIGGAINNAPYEIWVEYTKP